MYVFHIAAYYRYRAQRDTTTFGKWNMLDMASRYALAAWRKR
jgi:hypothetical protein